MRGSNTTRSLLCISIAMSLLIGLLIAGCGAPSQKEVVEKSKNEQVESKKNALLISNLGFLPYQNNPYLTDMYSYYVVGKLKNDNKKYTCTKANCSATLYNASGAVIGNFRGKVAPVYPGQERWYMSSAIDTSPETPARAELKISSETWSRVAPSNIPKFEILQKNLLPGDYQTKITGIVRYEGKETIDIAVTGVILNSSGNPIACGRADIEKVSAGDHPYSVETFVGNIDAASADVTAFETK